MSNKIREETYYVYFNREKNDWIEGEIVFKDKNGILCNGYFQCTGNSFGIEIAMLIWDNDGIVWEAVSGDCMIMNSSAYDYMLKITNECKPLLAEKYAQTIKLRICKTPDIDCPIEYYAIYSNTDLGTVDDRLGAVIEQVMPTFYKLATSSKQSYYATCNKLLKEDEETRSTHHYIVRYTGSAKISYQVEHFSYPASITRVRTCKAHNFTDRLIDCIFKYDKQMHIKTKHPVYLHEKRDIHCPIRAFSIDMLEWETSNTAYYEINCRHTRILHNVEMGVRFVNRTDMRRITKFLSDLIVNRDIR